MILLLGLVEGRLSVRMLVPPIVRRREMDRELVRFFHDHRKSFFRRAVSKFCRYYHVKSPRIEWYEYIDWGKTAGKTFEDGRIGASTRASGCGCRWYITNSPTTFSGLTLNARPRPLPIGWCAV